MPYFKGYMLLFAHLMDSVVAHLSLGLPYLFFYLGMDYGLLGSTVYLAEQYTRVG